MVENPGTNEWRKVQTSIEIRKLIGTNQTSIFFGLKMSILEETTKQPVLSFKWMDFLVILSTHFSVKIG